MSKMTEPIAGIASLSRPPSSVATGWPSSLPLRSHSAMSIALIANAAIPSTPYQ